MFSIDDSKYIHIDPGVVLLGYYKFIRNSASCIRHRYKPSTGPMVNFLMEDGAQFPPDYAFRCTSMWADDLFWTVTSDILLGDRFARAVLRPEDTNETIDGFAVVKKGLVSYAQLIKSAEDDLREKFPTKKDISVKDFQRGVGLVKWIGETGRRDELFFIWNTGLPERNGERIGYFKV